MFTRINLYAALFIIGLCAVLGFGCHPVAATTAQLETDIGYYSYTTDLTPEQLADKPTANKIWIAENGQWQPDLTASQEAEILVLVEEMKEAQ